MEAVECEPTPFERLTALRSEIYDADGLTITLVELSADQALNLWEQISDLEAAGRLVDIYRLLVFEGAWVGNERLFNNQSFEDTKRLPIRHLVPMGEAMLKLCDMGLDEGNGQGDPGPETSVTD